MLSSHTSSEEDNITNLRIFAQNTRNNDEGPKLLEDIADWHACFENIVSTFQAPSGLLSLWKSSSIGCANEFYDSFYLV